METDLTKARIFQRPRTATQAGKASAGSWVYDFAPAEREVNDPLMGWWGSGDTNNQVRLAFGTREEAVAFAEKKGVPYEVEEPPATRPIKPKTYADNFKFGRTENWTH